MAGDVDDIDVNAQLGRDIDARALLDDLELEGLPGVGLDPVLHLAHGQRQAFGIEGLFEAGGEVVAGRHLGKLV